MEIFQIFHEIKSGAERTLLFWPDILQDGYQTVDGSLVRGRCRAGRGPRRRALCGSLTCGLRTYVVARP
jgi:hypothetical protein